MDAEIRFESSHIAAFFIVFLLPQWLHSLSSSVKLVETAVLRNNSLDFRIGLYDLAGIGALSWTIGMAVEQDTSNSDYVTLAGDIVSAYVSKNSLPAADLPALITSVHAALTGLSGSVEPSVAPETVEKPSTAQVRKSITPDAIISFIDGKPYKTLKRHLGTHGLDPHSYRQRYGLPSDYPMVAPNYAAQRSALAKSIGLGRPGGRLEVEEKTRGRRKVA